MKRILYIAVAVSAVMSISGCQSKIEFEDMYGDVSVAFNPSINGTVAVSETKAGIVTSADGSFEIPIFCTVKKGISKTESPETKGEQLRPASSGSNALSSWLETFYVTAWDGTTRFMPASGETTTFDEVKYSSSAWTITGKEYKWDKNKDITFYAYGNLPSSGAAVAGTSSALTLSYTSVPTAAEDQKDIVMGYYKGKGSQDQTDKKKKNADILFHHPMTAVQFALGDFGEITVKVKSIILKNVYDGGTAVLNSTTAAATAPEERFTWTPSGTMQDVTLGESSSILSVNSSTKVIGEPFILVPQDLASKNVSVTIVATMDGVETVLSTVLKTDSWKAGNTYTYSISKEVNYDYTFKFSSKEISDTEASRMFDQNVDDTQTIADIYVTSTKAREDKPDDQIDQSWGIKSYRVGSGSEQTVQNNVIDIRSNTDQGIKVTMNSSTNIITVEAAERVKFGRGIHDYWVNTDGRTDELDWSPADWTTSTSSSPVDLSKYNFQTDTPNAFDMTTANCYIIRHAGKYKLPLVYGNAIVNGTTNTQSFYPKAGMSSSSGSYAETNGDVATDNNEKKVRLVRFKNYLGNGINSPYILTDINKTVSNIHAAILWQSDAQVISNLSVEGSGEAAYLKFEVSQNTVCQNDALIAILDASNNIIWSWQIWTTNDPALSAGPIRVKNYDNEAYDFLPITNIGFIEGQTYKGRDDIVVTLEQETSGKTLELTIQQPEIPSDGFSSIYQYGRKDPMCYNEDNPAYVNTDIVKFNDPYDDPDEGLMQSAVIIADPHNGSLANSIKYPFCFFHFEYGYENERWINAEEGPYRNLWSGIDAVGGNKNQTTGVQDYERCIKTVYDPSPVGYKVPAGKCFSGFTTTGDNLYTWALRNADKINGYVAPYGQGIYFYREQGTGHTVNTGGETILFKLSGIRVGLTGELRPYESMYYGANCENGSYGSRPSIMCFDTQVTPSAGITFLSVASYAASNGCSVRPVVDITYSNNPFSYVE